MPVMYHSAPTTRCISVMHAAPILPLHCCQVSLLWICMSICHVIPYRVISYHIVSCHVVSCHVTSHHVLSLKSLDASQCHSCHPPCLTLHSVIMSCCVTRHHTVFCREETDACKKLLGTCQNSVSHAAILPLASPPSHPTLDLHPYAKLYPYVCHVMCGIMCDIIQD